MQNKQLKRPYSPPEITAVEFRVERGMNNSIQVDAEGVKGQVIDDMMFFISSQNNPNGRMSEQMGYFGGSGYFSTGATQDGNGYF